MGISLKTNFKRNKSEMSSNFTGSFSIENQTEERQRVSVEMNSKLLKKEASCKDIWSKNLEVVKNGRLRIIEGEREDIQSLIEWAEANGANCDV